VLDRDAVMLPTGWDSYGKINVLRDRFDAGRVYKAWETSLQEPREEGVEGIEDVWDEVIPDTTAPKVRSAYFPSGRAYPPACADHTLERRRR